MYLYVTNFRSEGGLGTREHAMPRPDPARLRALEASDPRQRKLCIGLAPVASTPPTNAAATFKDASTNTDPAWKMVVSIPSLNSVEIQVIQRATECGMWLEDLVQRVVKEMEKEQHQETSKDVETQTGDKKKKERDTRPWNVKLKKEEKLVQRRRSYNTYERAIIIKKMDKGGATMNKVVKEVRKNKSFEGFSKSSLKRMMKNHVQQKRGRKVNKAFDEAVLSQLMYTVIENINSTEKVRVIANVAHSYKIIRKAAVIAQQMIQFKNDTQVQKLRFSKGWVSDLLKRNVLRRRRTTHITKNAPTPEQIQVHMEAIQDVIVEEEYCEDQVASADETGIFYGAPPKNQYIPSDADRACAPESDEKARFTSLEMGFSNGKMAPSFHVIKCVAKNADDLSATRVIHNLHTQPGFRAQEGWELHYWERTMTLQRKKQGVAESYVAKFKRPYIRHTQKLTVITCQVKAWMDTAGIAMWADTLLSLLVSKCCRGRLLIVWDNCGCHNVPALVDVFDDIGVKLMNLPPNVTDRLQVMDLVVNAPLKAGILRERCDELFEYMTAWKVDRLKQLALPEKERKLVVFKPPKPTITSGLRTVLKVEEECLGTTAFQASMKRCFVSVGLAPTELGDFVKYRDKKKGTLSTLHAQAEQANAICDPVSPRFCVGEYVAELELTARPRGKETPDDQQDDEWEEEEQGSESEDGRCLAFDEEDMELS